jgi:hypothetical protein
MLPDVLGWLMRLTARQPAFVVYGRARGESRWRRVSVLAVARRDMTSNWPAPFWPGTSIAWGSTVVAVGWDFAEALVLEQLDQPATRARPVRVVGGRLRSPTHRRAADETANPYWPSYSEILAHELGHTAQARRYSLLYLPLGAVFTLFREGDSWVNWFENQASRIGEFGGIIGSTLHPRLLAAVERAGRADALRLLETDHPHHSANEG